jgi:hypothetical protein
VVDVTETNTSLCLNNLTLDNVILNGTDTFIDSVGLIDVTEIDTGPCLRSVDFSSIILNNTSTLVLSVRQMVSSIRQWYYITVLVMVPDTGIQDFQCR